MDANSELQLLTNKSQELATRLALTTLTEAERKKISDEIKANMDRMRELISQIKK